MVHPVKSPHTQLTPLQTKLLEYLQSRDGDCPSYREIANHMGWKVLASVRPMLRVLEREGYVTLRPRHHRGIVLLTGFTKAEKKFYDH